MLSFIGREGARARGLFRLHGVRWLLWRRGRELARQPETWTYTLSPAQLDELDAAMRRTRGLDIGNMDYLTIYGIDFSDAGGDGQRDTQGDAAEQFGGVCGLICHVVNLVRVM